METLKKYLIRDLERKEEYWAGVCEFGPFNIQTKEWVTPKRDNNLRFNYCGNSISLYNDKPPIPYMFDSLKEAQTAIQYVPRKFNVDIISVSINFEVENGNNS